MAMESLSKRNGISMLDCETYKSIRNNPFHYLNCSCSLHCTTAKVSIVSLVLESSAIGSRPRAGETALLDKYTKYSNYLLSAEITKQAFWLYGCLLGLLNPQTP